MKLGTFVKTARKLLDDNSPAILTGLGVTGLLATTVAAVRATPEAIYRLRIEEFDREAIAMDEGTEAKPLTNVEKVKLAWRPYIPAAVIGGTTIACIIGSNSISSRRNATLISLYTISERMLGDYKEKVVEVLGESKAEKVRDAIAHDQVNALNKEIVILGEGNVACHDSLTGRVFESTVEKIRKAENDINRQCINEMYASQNDFYRLIGLPAVDIGEEVGWTTDNPIEIQFTAVIFQGKPVMSLDYRKQPKAGFHKVW